VRWIVEFFGRFGCARLAGPDANVPSLRGRIAASGRQESRQLRDYFAQLTSHPSPYQSPRQPEFCKKGIAKLGMTAATAGWPAIPEFSVS